MGPPRSSGPLCLLSNRLCLEITRQAQGREAQGPVLVLFLITGQFCLCFHLCSGAMAPAGESSVDQEAPGGQHRSLGFP